MYTRLTLPGREEISRGLAAGLSLRAIAACLGRPASTLTRELARALAPLHDTVGALEDPGDRRHPFARFYRAYDAHHSALALRASKESRSKRLDHEPLKEEVLRLLDLEGSPEQVSEHLSAHPDPLMHVSHETLYAHLYGLNPAGTGAKALLEKLRLKKSLHRKPRTAGSRKHWSEDARKIEDRPPEVEDRSGVGHWEADLVVGSGSSALLVMLERVTRRCELTSVTRDSASVRDAMTEVLVGLPPGPRKTVAYDRDAEMARWKEVEAATGTEVYFCHPHSLWEKGAVEKGAVENLNGLIRQYVRKGTDFRGVIQDLVRHVQGRLNTRPRKVLSHLTPD